ncbi:MAG: SBBP repeat-containing protein, partial [Candidatus Aminicenantes bacterium]|nr:SBBP repeat-containing protein [Candidatus Aminicenantes bacterium]
TDIAMARDVVVDASNNIYVCGGLFNGNWDLLAVKFDKNGSRLWSKTVNCTGDDTDVAAAICVTPSGAVTIAGSSKRTAYNHDIVTAKFDKDGRHLWLKAFNGRKNGDDGLGGLALDAKGNAYVTGWTTVAAVDWDFATMKYGPSGKTLWTKTYHGPTEGDYGRTIALDRSGNAYVVGESRNERGNDDITTLKYDPAGKARWGLRYDGPGLVDDIPSAIVLDAAGNIYIAGTCGGSGTGTDFVLIKY